MTSISNNNLFKPIKVGRVELAQRIAMSPMTRVRATSDTHVPTEIMKTYYEQRASAPGTLLVTEATFITERAGGYPYAPGIWSKDQIASWKKVTDAVHAKDSHIFLQLWALGRSAGPTYIKSIGHDFVSASNVPENTGVATYFSGKNEPGVIPRGLTIAEIKEYVQDYATAAKNAIAAGFDGVEIHAANGYLLQQFLDERCNTRTDEYGGSVENRARFTLEVVDSVVKAVGADRVGIRLSPYEKYGDMVYGPGTLEQYAYLLKKLEELGIDNESEGRLAYVHAVENTFEAKDSAGKPIIRRPMEFVRNVWSGVLIRTQKFDKETAVKLADVDDKLIIGFGRPFLANPDLVRRLKEDIPLNKSDYQTLYTHGPEGYIDYPFSK